MTRTEATDILIVGGGIPGLTLAVLLARIGVAVTLVDAQSPAPEKPGSRTSALMTGSVNILKAAGIGADIFSQGAIMTGLAIVDDSAHGKDPMKIMFEAADIGQDFFAINMPNYIVRNELLAIAQTLDKLRLHAPARLTDYDTDDHGVTARFDGAPAIKARLIVGADGRDSQTRQQAGIATWERDYGQSAITCVIDHTLPHRNISTEFHRPGGPFTLVPLPGNRSSVVWVDFTAQTEQFMRMSQSACRQALQDRSQGLLGEVTLASPLQCWPLKGLKAKTLTARRTALIAEAAHVLHPLGAQGLNLSLRDTAVLAEILADALRLGQDPGSRATLHAYETNRQRDVSLRVTGTDMLTRMVSNNLPFLRHARILGLKTLENITPLRDLIMREGMAPQDTGSRLAAGRGL